MRNLRFRRAPGRYWLLAMLTAFCVGAHAAGIAPDDESQPRAVDASASAIRVLTWNVLEPSPLDRLLGFVFEPQATRGRGRCCGRRRRWTRTSSRCRK